jgi:hypothetical protein
LNAIRLSIFVTEGVVWLTWHHVKRIMLDKATQDKNSNILKVKEIKILIL